MSPKFLFIDDVHQALASGRKVVEVPEGVRITPAARDLIAEKKLTVKYVAPEPPPSAAAASETETPVAGSALKKLMAARDFDFTEDDIETILDRVIERFQKARGGVVPVVTPAAPDDDLVICRCEEITKGEIREAIRNGMTTLNGVKRVTRAGMGLCQGQTCQQLVSRILAQELGVSPAEVEPTTARAPVRPIPLAVFATG